MEDEQKTLKAIFSVNVKKHRRSLNLSQEEFAAKAGISPVTVSKIERGLQWPSSVTIEKISNVLGIPYTSLFQDINFENTNTLESVENQLTEIHEILQKIKCKS